MTGSPAPSRVYIALLHAPVYNKAGELVTSAVTNLDIHDIARTARTYGLGGYYIVTPDPEQRTLVGRICSHWLTGYGAGYNSDRGEALGLVETASTLEAAVMEIEKRNGRPPRLFGTTASVSDDEKGRLVTFNRLRSEMAESDRPYLILLGTGWGIDRGLLAKTDGVLAPIAGHDGYNHLPVRGAAAIIMDRLFGQFE